MKKNKIMILMCVFLIVLMGCGETSLSVNKTENTIIKNNENVVQENKEETNNVSWGKEALSKLGNGLYYDSTTKIVYWYDEYNNKVIAPYYASNGFPYKFNPETSTLEAIE